MYGSSNPPVCPTILITVSAEDEPSTVTKLNYKISLRGIKPSGTTMYIVRDLCNRGKHITACIMNMIKKSPFLKEEQACLK